MCVRHATGERSCGGRVRSGGGRSVRRTGSTGVRRSGGRVRKCAPPKFLSGEQRPGFAPSEIFTLSKSRHRGYDSTVKKSNRPSCCVRSSMRIRVRAIWLDEFYTLNKFTRVLYVHRQSDVPARADSCSVLHPLKFSEVTPVPGGVGTEIVYGEWGFRFSVLRGSLPKQLVVIFDRIELYA